MKTVKGKSKPTNWAVPGEISEDEFLKGIKKAEKGPFFSVHESMARFDLWLKTREKK